MDIEVLGPESALSMRSTSGIGDLNLEHQTAHRHRCACRLDQSPAFAKHPMHLAMERDWTTDTLIRRATSASPHGAQAMPNWSSPITLSLGAALMRRAVTGAFGFQMSSAACLKRHRLCTAAHPENGFTEVASWPIHRDGAIHLGTASRRMMAALCSSAPPSPS